MMSDCAPFVPTHWLKSEAQAETRATGEQRAAVRWLNRHSAAAVVFFLLMIVAGGFWIRAITNLSERLFSSTDRRLDDVPLATWFAIAVVWTVAAYLAILYLFRLPITAAFTY